MVDGCTLAVGTNSKVATFTLTGTGTQALSTPGSLAIVVTSSTSAFRNGNANPTNWYDVGLCRLGTAHGYLPSFPVDGTHMVVPCPVGTNILGYKLASGVTITVEERAEILQPTATLPGLASPQPTVITPISILSFGVELAAINGASFGGVTNPVANKAYFYPFRLSGPFAMAYAFNYNAASNSGHWDIGVYDAAFNRLGSTGSTSMTGPVTAQCVVLPLNLAPGLYWMALAVDNATAQMYTATLTTPKPAFVGVRTLLSAFPLPDPAVPTANVLGDRIFAFGISTYRLN